MTREESSGEAGAMHQGLAPDGGTPGESSVTGEGNPHQPAPDEVMEAPERPDMPSHYPGGPSVPSENLRPDQLDAVVRSQREFVRDAGHELRDRLTICRGHLELISDDPNERRATIALVLNELERMGRIIDDLQVLAEADQPDFLRCEWIDVALFVHELIAKASSLDLRNWTLDNTPEGTLFADRQHLTQAVMNLMLNAVQHTLPEDSITLGASLSQDGARVWVRDNGSGILGSDQARIFDRFVRGTDTGRYYRGSGLGLAIVKAIANAHGGHVELESRVGEGSTFTIIVPRHPREEGTGD
jgi:two-component system, OmpR family, sensor kinase